MTVSVRDHGAVGDGTTDDTAAILAAQAALTDPDEPLHLPVGVYRCSATLTAQTIVGDSRRGSVLLYTGTGAAISVTDPAVRSHNKLIRDLAVVTPTAGDVALDGVPGAGTPVAGTVGINLASHSRANITNVTVAGFGTGVAIGGQQNALYNTLVDVVAGACTVGYAVTSYLANENRWIGSRTNACGTGWDLYAGDRNWVIGGAAESGGVGVRITGADADGCLVMGCRFENNTGLSVYVGPEVPDVTVVDNQVYDSSGALDVRAARRTVRDSRRPYAEVHTDRGDRSFVVERNAATSTSTPMAVLRDTRTDWGNPTTLQLEQGRWSGHFVRGVRPQDNVELWRVNGDGVIKTRAGSAPPSAGAAGVGGMFFHTGLKRPIWSDGSVWRTADGTAI